MMTNEIRNIYWPKGICFAHDSYPVLVATTQRLIITVVQTTAAHTQLIFTMNDKHTQSENE